MELENLIDWSQVRVARVNYEVTPNATLPPTADSTLDHLIHTNTRVLRAKLDAIAAAVEERLNIRRQNIQRIADDRDKLTEETQRVSVAANYHLRDRKEEGALFQKGFDLTRERRDQDTECWRDIVLVLRDFLGFWDEYERAKARGAFLQDVR